MFVLGGNEGISGEGCDDAGCEDVRREEVMELKRLRRTEGLSGAMCGGKPRGGDETTGAVGERTGAR